MTDAPEFPAESAEPAAAAPAAPAPVTDPFAVPSGVAPEAAAPAEPEADVEPVAAEEAVAEQAAEEAAPEEAAPVAEAIVAEPAEAPAAELVATAEESAADSGADDSGADEEIDPAEELRQALRLKPGEWYVVHSYAGYENRVKSNIESRTTSLNMEDYIFQVEVPTEEVVEIKNNQRKNVKRQKFPGYVLVRMELTDGSWSAVRNTPGVTGFVGHGHQPTPLTLDEVVDILAPAEEKKTTAGGGAVTEVRVLDFEVGDSVTITGEHAFAGLLATIHEVNPDSRRVKAFVEIFGRETPVELEFSNIQKN